ncbi:tRNA-guanine transglycosylase [Shigella flexneri]
MLCGYSADWDYAKRSWRCLRWLSVAVKRFRRNPETKTRCLVLHSRQRLRKILRDISVKGLVDSVLMATLPRSRPRVSRKQHDRILEATCPQIPADKPRYLMGVCNQKTWLKAYVVVIHMFYCVMPTCNALMVICS